MATQVPQKNDFDKAGEREKYSCWSKYAVITISLVTAILSIFPLKIEQLDCGLSILAVITVMMMSYFSKRAEAAYRKAEATRRDGLIDSAFETKIADVASVGYYDTDEVKAGIGKLLSNIHENSICSARTVEQMLKKQEPKMIVIIILIFIALFINFMGTKFVVVLVDIFLSTECISEYLKLRRLEQDCLNVQEKCKEIWEQYESAKYQFDILLTGKAFRVVLQYEAALSYASMMLDTDAFGKIQFAAEQEWEDIKKRYHMDL